MHDWLMSEGVMPRAFLVKNKLRRPTPSCTVDDMSLRQDVRRSQPKNYNTTELTQRSRTCADLTEGSKHL